ncbi:MAG: RepB family plasmid replication initiator protein [Peptostreptococcaceae bacterium]
MEIITEDKSMKNKDKDSILIKHNTLVSARYSLTPNECRIFTYMLYKIQKLGESNIEKACNITQEEFKSIISDKNKSSIKGITTILKALKKNDIYLKEKKDDKNNYIWSEYSFISGFEFDDELNNFKVVCADKVFNTLMNHDYKKDGFYTPINLLVWFQFKLNSTQRIYELLRLWSNSKKIINYTVQDLREHMMLENKYSQYRDFKKRIITPAIKELNETGEFNIEIKENRVGKQVVSIDFIVMDLDKRVYFDKLSETKTEYISENNKVNIEQCEDKSESKTFYIPNKKLFTAKTLSDFTNDFKDYDFKDSTYKKLLQDSILITLEKDNEEKIKVKSYNYFKKTLENKIKDTSNISNPKQVKTRFHNINQTFNKYSPDELENRLQESQKYKFEDYSKTKNDETITSDWEDWENKIG